MLGYNFDFSDVRENADGSIYAMVDGAQLTIPKDPANRHYAAILTEGIEVADYTAPQPTRADIDRERDRRMGLGAVVPITGYDPIHVTGNPSDQIIFGSLIDTARYLSELGVADPVMAFRDANNVNHMLTPAQITELVMGGRAAGAAIYEASWALKDNPPIPEDYADDAHWPALIPDGEPE